MSRIVTLDGNQPYDIYADTNWEDLRFPFTGQKIDVSAGRIDYNYAQ